MQDLPSPATDPPQAAGRTAAAFRVRDGARLPAWTEDALLRWDEGEVLTVEYGAAVDGQESAAEPRKPRLRILLSAYSLEPDTLSERGVGWRWALDLAAAGHEVWIITCATNAGAIERALGAQRVTNLHFIYHDLPAWARTWRRWKRGVRALSALWRWGAHRVARGLSDRVAFDAGFEVKGRSVETALKAMKRKGPRDKAPRSL